LPRACAGNEGREPSTRINILPHADGLTVFVEKLGVPDKAVLFVKSQHTFVVFYVGINGEETGGATILITSQGFTRRGFYHK
jgi:hypothetical protein